jgi:hypothetical protein
VYVCECVCTCGCLCVCMNVCVCVCERSVLLCLCVCKFAFECVMRHVYVSYSGSVCAACVFLDEFVVCCLQSSLNSGWGT